MVNIKIKEGSINQINYGGNFDNGFKKISLEEKIEMNYEKNNANFNIFDFNFDEGKNLLDINKINNIENITDDTKKKENIINTDDLFNKENLIDIKEKNNKFNFLKEEDNINKQKNDND